MIKKPQQARSRRTRDKLMSALESLLKDKEFDQITVTDIAKTAGVSTGLLYAHFKNKAAFLEALLGRYKSRLLLRLEQVESEGVEDEFRALGGLREALHVITDFAFDQVREDAHIIRAISHSLRSQSNTDQNDWQDLRSRAFQTIAPVIEVYADDIARPDKSLTAEMLVYFFNSIFMDAIMNREFGTTTMKDISRDVFVSEIADFAYGYLTTPAP